MSAFDLTISIVNFNSTRYLQACLDSIFKNTEGISFEVIVVDNASRDDPSALVPRFPNVKWIFNSDNRFFMKAHNQALGLSQGRFFLILNPDTLVPSGTLQTIVAYLSSHPETGAATCRELDIQNNLVITGTQFPTPWVEIVKWTGLRRWFSRQVLAPYLMDDWDRTTSRRIDVASGCFVMVHAEVLRRAGGLDERILLYYSEYDLCAKVAEAGLQVQFLSDPFYIHHGQRSSVQEDVSRIREIHFQDMYWYYRIHFGWIQATAGTAAIRAIGVSEHLMHWLMPIHWFRFLKRKMASLRTHASLD